MSNPTTPFSWQMPTATDLVTDLPADFEVFGQAVATSMQYLLGGTTGQILSKTSATDMAFTWTTPNPGDITGVTAGTGISGGGTSGDVTITNSMATAMTTSGDLIQATGSGTFARLGTGTAGQYLTTNGTTNSWGTISSGSYTQIATGTLSSTSVVMSSIPQTYKQLVLTIDNAVTSGTNGTLCFRVNAKTTNYYSTIMSMNSATLTNNAANDRFKTNIALNSAGGLLSNATIYFPNYSSSQSTCTMYGVEMDDSAGSFGTYYPYQLFAAITSITLLGDIGQTMTGGTYTLYGVK